jgi:hypothetical protein
MKRLTLVLVGCGVILLTSCWKNLAAQSLIMPEYDYSIDSSRTLVLQERAERNFTYIKAGKADPGKVAGEFMLGGLGGLLVGGVGAGLGFSAFSKGSGGCLGCFDVGGIIGGLVGYAVGSNVGCATGVYVVGNSGGETGSYWAGLGGSLLGTIAGVLLAAGIFQDLADNDGAAPLFVLSAAQAGGATLCFNATRKQKLEVPSGAMLNLKDGNIALSFPQMSVSQDVSNSNCFELNFFEASF